MHLPRFRIRTLMATVVVIALLATIRVNLSRFDRLSQYYRARAHAAALEETRMRLLAESQNSALVSLSNRRNLPTGDYKPLAAELDVAINRTTRSKAYYSELRRKYFKASRHPWSAVEPDPPEPK